MLEYKMNIKISDEDVDGKGNIKAASLLHFFQEVASADVKTFGFGPGDLIKENHIWVLTKLKYRIYGNLNKGEDYSLVTCPRIGRPRTVTYKRDYYIYDGSGNMIVASASRWCILNFVTRKIERLDLNFNGDYRKEEAFEEGIEKIHSISPVLVGKHLVVEDDLDQNQHTNNCRYAEMIGEVTGTTGYHDLVICFSKETVLGDEILLYKETSEDGGIVVTGNLEDGDVVFQAKVK